MKERKLAIVVHGGAGPASSFLHQNIQAYEEGLEQAVNIGYQLLEQGGSAIDAVQAAVEALENNPLFNAGRGSALNNKGEVEMCASIMDGKNLRSGAVALVKNIKNPVSLARAVMQDSPHVFLGCEGAVAFARKMNIEMEEDNYFVVQHQLESFQKMKTEEEHNPELQVKGHGTVGAVACDSEGNVAAATSTGGIEFSHAGRIGDSASVGAGVYANNETCAVSATGQGEVIIKHVLCHQLHTLMELKNMSLRDAAPFVIYDKLKHEKEDMGIIAVDSKGNIGMAFNSERMHRAWKTSDGEMGKAIFAGKGHE